MSDDSDDRLRAAIEAHVQEAAATPGLLLIDWIVVAATQGWNDDGDQVTAVTITPGGGAAYRMMGLLDEAMTRFRADLVEEYSAADGDD